MKKLLVAVLGLLLVAALAGAGTFAYFSDTETSTGNTFTAGTLDLQGEVEQNVTQGYGTVEVVNQGNGGNFAFTVSDVAPGSAGRDIWTLENIGSIPGVLSFAVSDVTNAENDLGEPESEAGDETGDVGELGDNMTVTLWIDLDGDGVMDDDEVLYDQGSLNGMANIYDELVVLEQNETVDVYLDWSIGGDVGNIIQSDSASFDITFELEQVQPS